MGACIPENRGITRDPFAESFDAGCRKDKIRRLLVPFKDMTRLENCLCYAGNLEAAGVSVHLALLHVVDAVPHGDSTTLAAVDRYGEAGDVATRALVDQVGARLAGTAFRCSVHVRRGDVVFTIFDMAEQIDSDEIVLPMPRPSLLPRIFSPSFAYRLMRLQRAVPVVMVDTEGRICKTTNGAATSDMPVLPVGGGHRSSRPNIG